MRVLALLGVAIAGIIFLQERYPQRNVTAGVNFQFNERQPVVSADAIRLLSFGYSRLLSNLLWLKFLQETPNRKVPPGELSWIFFDLDTISTIDPDFYPAVEHGGLFLSVITEDKVGGEKLLVKGTKLFPDRWRVFAYLAYHYHIEMQDADRAGPFYLIGSKLAGAPPILGMLAARQMAKEESIEASISFLEGLRNASTDDVAKEKFQARIDMWKAKMAMRDKK